MEDIGGEFSGRSRIGGGTLVCLTAPIGSR
jgi:hypothetical protein